MTQRGPRPIVGHFREHAGRRAFLKTGGRALAGIAGILAAGRAPATWAARELSLLTAVNYAPASDAKLSELAKRFTKASGVNVRIDHIQSVQMPAKLSAEIMSKSGHDIISLEMHYAWLFQPGLADVSEICNDLARKHGEWYPFAKEHALVKGQWLGVPYMFTSFPGSQRIDLFEKVAEDGRTIPINSKATETAIDYVQTLYNDAMDPAVLSWDNASNNQWLNSGKGSWIHNPISHYVVAKQEKLPVAELTGFHPSPAGPNGRHSVGVPRSLGIWKFSKNVDVARDFLKWFFEPAQYHEWIMSGDNYNHPTWRDMENHPVWDVDKKYKPLKPAAKYSHLYGWPAPPDEKIQLITNSYIIPNMFARVVTNASKPKDAMLWAETEIKRAFERS